jgi:hypothetical protein
LQIVLFRCCFLPLERHTILAERSQVSVNASHHPSLLATPFLSPYPNI